MWPETDVIGWRVLIELNRVDSISSLQCSLGNPMSTVHHHTTGGEDYREGQVRLFDQPHVRNQCAPSWPFLSAYPFLI